MMYHSGKGLQDTPRFIVGMTSTDASIMLIALGNPHRGQSLQSDSSTVFCNLNR